MSDKLYDNYGNEIGEVRHSGMGAGGWLALITLGLCAAHDIERRKTIADQRAYARSRGLADPAFEDEPSWFLSGIGMWICGFLAVFGIVFGIFSGDSGGGVLLLLGMAGLIGCGLIFARWASYNRNKEESERLQRWTAWDVVGGIDEPEQFSESHRLRGGQPIARDSPLNFFDVWEAFQAANPHYDSQPHETLSKEFERWQQEHGYHSLRDDTGMTLYYKD